MAKYRLLRREELEELEKEFVDYLILNGITADDWKKIKEHDCNKAEEILDLFSDVVFEGIMRKTKYLDRRGISKLETLQCLNDRFVLVCLDASKVNDANLTDNAFIQRVTEYPPKGIEIFTTEIKYKKQREMELYEKVQQGFQISDSQLFKILCLALPSG